jgi:hypothetical protein
MISEKQRYQALVEGAQELLTCEFSEHSKTWASPRIPTSDPFFIDPINSQTYSLVNFIWKQIG